MLDHVGIRVSDYARSKAFYDRALAPLGVVLLMEPAPGVGGYVLDPDGNNVEAVCHAPE